ncbi:hypothetical protein JL722_4091 [Aureococcus anophagefferens]|nr:hypothetical protein JL722_4091 [Aureococcus anophagefferens]
MGNGAGSARGPEPLTPLAEETSGRHFEAATPSGRGRPTSAPRSRTPTSGRASAEPEAGGARPTPPPADGKRPPGAVDLPRSERSRRAAAKALRYAISDDDESDDDAPARALPAYASRLRRSLDGEQRRPRWSPLPAPRGARRVWGRRPPPGPPCDRPRPAAAPRVAGARAEARAAGRRAAAVEARRRGSPGAAPAEAAAAADARAEPEPAAADVDDDDSDGSDAARGIIDTTEVTLKKAPLPTDMAHPMPTSGDFLKKRFMVNNYILLEAVGTGSYAEVRLAKEKRTDALYAVKVINKDVLRRKLTHPSAALAGNGASDTMLDDVKREIAIMKKLSHPHVSGSSRSWTTPRTCLVGEDGIVKIADFGISKMLAGDGGAFRCPRHARSCAPHLRRRALRRPERGRLALGATMFMLRAGRPPFVADKVVHHRIIHHSSCPGPRRRARLLGRMLEKAPGRRATLGQRYDKITISAADVGSALGASTRARRRADAGAPPGAAGGLHEEALQALMVPRPPPGGDDDDSGDDDDGGDRAEVVIPDLRPGLRAPERYGGYAYMAIFDGHDGDACASFLQHELHGHLCRQAQFFGDARCRLEVAIQRTQELGATAFKAKDYKKAYEYYNTVVTGTEYLQQTGPSPNDSTYLVNALSNRSACKLGLGDAAGAFATPQPAPARATTIAAPRRDDPPPRLARRPIHAPRRSECVRLRPKWQKAWYRFAAYDQGKVAEAEAAFAEGIQLDLGNGEMLRWRASAASAWTSCASTR